MPTKHPFPHLKKQAIQFAIDALEGGREKCLILDTETTGLRSNDEIIEICLMDMDGNALFNTLVKPKRRKKIPDASFAVHGISMETLKDAPSFGGIYPDLVSLTQGKNVLVYNKDFDARLVNQTASKYECEHIDTSNWICVMQYYSVFCGEINPKYNDFKWQKLPNAGHRSETDCKAVLDLIKAMASAAPESGNACSKSNMVIWLILGGLLLLAVLSLGIR